MKSRSIPQKEGAVALHDDLEWKSVHNAKPRTAERNRSRQDVRDGSSSGNGENRSGRLEKPIELRKGVAPVEWRDLSSGRRRNQEGSVAVKALTKLAAKIG